MLPDFPEAGPPPGLSDALRRRGIQLRGATPADLDGLRDLYAGTRAAELAFAPWSPQQKRAFTDDQFRLQHLHFIRHHGGADFWLIEQSLPPARPHPIGRLYLDRSTDPWQVVDITVVTESRGQGLGSALLAWLQAASETSRRSGLALSVALNNPRAESLYRRLGFEPDGAAGAMHLRMRWRPALS